MILKMREERQLNMRTLNVKYRTGTVKINVAPGLFLKQNLSFLSGKTFVITDDNIAKLYLSSIKKVIPQADVYIVAAGENSKTMTTVMAVIERLITLAYSKSDTIIALGGGVITDLTGFIAAVYKRGCRYVSIPTTLLAQVDSAVGGKCGVNFKQYKNQIGTYYHPQYILVDTDFIKTLPPDEYLSGMGEIIKYGLVFDRALFDSLDNDFLLSDIIYRCLQIKTQVTGRDEFESGERGLLNFGHTVAHALESLSGYKIKHGLAVAAGMYYEVKDEAIRKRLL